MANFNTAAAKILKLEGKYQNQKKDSGNYNLYTASGRKLNWKSRQGLRAGTMYGISCKLYSSIKGRQVSKAEMKAISQAEALSIYKRIYWDVIGADSINHQACAVIIFDGKVNMGGWCRLLQKVLNDYFGESLKVDNAFGRNTKAAMMRAAAKNPIKLYNGYRIERINWYSTADPYYREGWLNRMKKFPALEDGSSGTAGAEPIAPPPPPPPPAPTTYSNTTPTTTPEDNTTYSVTLPTFTVTAPKPPKKKSNNYLIGFGAVILIGAAVKSKKKK